MVKMIWIGPGEDYSLAKQVREHVFIEEQGFSPDLEFDRTDPLCRHLVLVGENGAPVATGRLIDEGDGCFSLGRIAVEKPLRGTGAGKALVKEMIRMASSLGATQCRLGAQDHAVGFYEKMGFSVCGPVYMDEHVPHYPMRMPAPRRT